VGCKIVIEALLPRLRYHDHNGRFGCNEGSAKHGDARLYDGQDAEVLDVPCGVFFDKKNLAVSHGADEESSYQLPKALCRFADCLPRQELKLVLCPSLQIQRAVAKLYTKLIHFMVHAMRWYQKSRPKRAIGAMFKPFALDFEEELNEVNELSRSVDEIATATTQAELRAVHAKVDEANAEIALVRLEMKWLGELVTQEGSRAFQVASCTTLWRRCSVSIC
jgi:hypothetical protein